MPSLRTGRRTEPGAIRAPQERLTRRSAGCAKAAKGPMVPTYTAQNPGVGIATTYARPPDRMGWSSCPTKSVPARMIEDAVIDQFRKALHVQENAATAQCLGGRLACVLKRARCELVRRLVETGPAMTEQQAQFL